MDSKKLYCKFSLYCCFGEGGGGIVCQSLDDVEFLDAVVCVLWNKSQYRFGFAMGWW